MIQWTDYTTANSWDWTWNY